MHFRLLGHIEVVDDGTSLTLGGIRARATLGYLLLNHNSVIPVSRLMKALWPNGTPATGRKMLHNAISHLRGVIGTNSMTARAPVLLTHAPGYFLRVQGESVDMICFRQLVDAARGDLAAGRWEQAADTLRGALALWRGPAMVDLVEAGVNWAELTALENDRRAAIECLVDADLALGRHAQVISELETQLQAGPLRERMAGQLMRALYHCGRQSDALALYQRTRTALIEEFGLDPSPELQQLERAILNHALVGGTAVRPSADQPAELIVHSDSASPLPSRPASAGLNAVPDVASDRVVPDTSAEAEASVSAALTAVPDVASDRVVPDTSAEAEASVSAALTAVPDVASDRVVPDTSAEAEASVSAALTAVPDVASDRVVPDTSAGAGSSASTVATAAVASEIKQVSIVLVRAIKETAEASDPAAAALTHERTTRVVEAEAARWGGTMAGTLGSLWMVVFGVPVSGEFDAWHAARAARTISHRLTRQPPNEDGPDGDPSGAVVVATGKALVQPSGGSPSAVSGAVFDRAMGQLIAARPGEVSMCEQTAAAGRTTERRTLSLVNVPTGGASEPFVGRDHDMRVLQHAWAQVRRLHHPHLVTVLGPAGMGKTRLLAEFTGRAAGADPAAECLIGSCAPAEPGGTGFDALADIVKARCGVATDGSESHTRARLASAVTGLSGLNRPDWVLGHLCDLVFGTTDGGEDAVSAWCSFLEATVVERPAVLVLEDAHCAADAVLDVVDQLASSTGPLLTVVTARPEELLGRRPGWGGGKRYASATVLQPLDDRDIRELAATRLGRRNRDGAPTLVDAVVTKAGGNPFFALELAATLAGSADRPVSAVQHATGSTSLSLSLPPAVRAVLDAQIDTLPLVAKTVLLDAVVLGASFCGGAVAAIGSACAADVEQGLRHLERLDLVARNGQLSPAGRPEYEFRISALRDVAYERLVPAAREEKQRIVAGWRFRLPDSDKLAS